MPVNRPSSGDCPLFNIVFSSLLLSTSFSILLYTILAFLSAKGLRLSTRAFSSCCSSARASLSLAVHRLFKKNVEDGNLC